MLLSLQRACAGYLPVWIKMNSKNWPGLRPIGVCDHLPLRSTFSLLIPWLGSRLAQEPYAWTGSGILFRPLGAPRLDFCCFFRPHFSQRFCAFFQNGPKSIKSNNKLTLVAFGFDLGWFWIILEPIWTSFFLFFLKRRKVAKHYRTNGSAMI